MRVLVIVIVVNVLVLGGGGFVVATQVTVKLPCAILKKEES